MRTLIDIQDELVKDLLRETKAKTKKDAIVTAIESYLGQKRREALASLIGNYDFGYNLEELEEMRKDDSSAFPVDLNDARFKSTGNSRRIAG